MSSGVPPTPAPASPADGSSATATATATDAPATEACPLCGTPLRHEQDWCVQCGAAARTRLAAPPGWRVPVIALIALVIACAVGTTAALVKLSGGSGTTIITTPAPVAAPAPVAPPAGATGPTGATAPPAPLPTAPALPSTGATGPSGRPPVTTPTPGPPGNLTGGAAAGAGSGRTG